MNKLPLSLLVCTTIAIVPTRTAHAVSDLDKAVLLHHVAEHAHHEMVELSSMPALHKHIMEMPADECSEAFCAVRDMAMAHDGKVTMSLAQAALHELGMTCEVMRELTRAGNYLIPQFEEITVSTNLTAPNINTASGQATTIGSSAGDNVSIDAGANKNINIGTSAVVHTINIGNDNTVANIIKIGGHNSEVYIDGTIVDIKLSKVQTDSLVVDKTADIGGDLKVYNSMAANLDTTTAPVVFSVDNLTGNTVVEGTLSVTGATTLSNTLAVTGAATLSNTLAVAGDVSVNTNKFTVAAASGNTAIAGTLAVTGATTLTGAAQINNTVGVTGVTSITNATDSTSTANGALVVSGGVGIAKKLNVGDNLTVNTDKFVVIAASGNTAIAGTLGVAGNVAVNTDKFVVTAASGNTAIAGTLGVAGNVAVNTDKFVVTASSGDTAIKGVTSITNDTDSTATTDGALVVSGGAGIAKKLYVGGDLHLGADKFVVTAASGNTAIAGTLSVTGATTLTGAAQINNTLGVTGVTSLTNATNTTASNSGALVVTGSAGIGGRLNVAGTFQAPLSNGTGSMGAFQIWSGNESPLSFTNGVASLTLTNVGTIVGAVLAPTAGDIPASPYNTSLAFKIEKDSMNANKAVVTAYNSATGIAISGGTNVSVKINYIVFGTLNTL
jgi:hypothetical protein